MDMPGEHDPSFACGVGITASACGVIIGMAAMDSHLRDSTARHTMAWTGTLPADLTESGAGGLDTGSVAASTWYAVHVIGDKDDGKDPEGMFSLSPTAPTLPATYDVFRHIGWVKTDAGSNIIEIHVEGCGCTKSVYYLDAVSNRQVLPGGAAEAPAEVDCSGFVPSGSTLAIIHVVNNSALRTVRLYKTTTGAILLNVAPDSEVVMEFPLTTARKMAYDNSGAGGDADIFLLGYKMETM